MYGASDRRADGVLIEENEMNGNLKILVLLVALSLGFALVSTPTDVQAGDDPRAQDGIYLGRSNDYLTEQSDSSEDGDDTGDGSGNLDGDPDDVGGGFGVRGDYILWGTELDGEDLEAMERWLRLLMLQILPTP